MATYNDNKMKDYDSGFEFILTNGKWFKFGVQFTNAENMTTIVGGEFNRVIDLYLFFVRFSYYWIA